MEWLDMEHEVDAHGHPTSLARVLCAIAAEGCSGNDVVGDMEGNPGPCECLGCLCEKALRDLWEERERAKPPVPPFGKRWVAVLVDVDVAKAMETAYQVRGCEFSIEAIQK